MKALVIRERNGHPTLVLDDVDPPQLSRGEIRVRVQASALNRADLLQVRGLYPPPEGTRPDIPGLEFAGIVEESHSLNGLPAPGTRVMGLLPGEGFAEQVVLPAELAMPVPGSLTPEQAAGIPEVFLTAFDALFPQLKLSPGERLLIHSVGSGVGTAALQMAKLAGAIVIGTAGSDKKLDQARKLGLDWGINYKQESLEQGFAACPFGASVDAVLDLVGACHWQANMRILRTLGRLIIVGLVSGAKVEADLGMILRKRLRIMGTALRSRTFAEKAALTAAFSTKMLPMFESGRLHPVIDTVFEWTEIEEAMRYMGENRNFGKIVLSIP